MKQCDRCFMTERLYARHGMPRCKKDVHGFHNFVSRGKAYKAWVEHVGRQDNNATF